MLGFLLDDLQDVMGVKARHKSWQVPLHELEVELVAGRPAAVITTSGTAVANLLPAAVEADFAAGLRQLEAAPLSTPAIRDLLAQGRAAWEQLLATVPQAGQPGGRMQLAAASEDLLSALDRLTQAYQDSVEMLLG